MQILFTVCYYISLHSIVIHEKRNAVQSQQNWWCSGIGNIRNVFGSLFLKQYSQELQQVGKLASMNRQSKRTVCHNVVMYLKKKKIC